MISVDEYRALVAKAMSEDDLLNLVIAELAVNGWRWHHVRRSDRAQQLGDPGFPDLIATRGDRLVVIELKSHRGRYEFGQAEWLDAFRLAGAETYTWRPGDLEQIRRVLA